MMKAGIKRKAIETFKKYKYLFLYYFHHLMKNISLRNMHVDNVTTILYDCLQQLEYNRPIEKQVSISNW